MKSRLGRAGREVQDSQRTDLVGPVGRLEGLLVERLSEDLERADKRLPLDERGWKLHAQLPLPELENLRGFRGTFGFQSEEFENGEVVAQMHELECTKSPPTLKTRLNREAEGRARLWNSCQAVAKSEGASRSSAVSLPESLRRRARVQLEELHQVRRLFEAEAP